MKQEAVPIRNWKSDLMPYLPPHVRQMLEGVSPHAPLEEIRIRAQKPLQLCFSGYERLLYLPGGRAAVTADECQAMLHRLCEQSLYCWETELGNGFLTLPGGYRVGLSGAMLLSGDGQRRLTEATAFNIRIARQIIGAAENLLPLLLLPDKSVASTLIVSAPGCGKTTLLRDIARSASYGINGAKPSRVAVVDTRYELAGCTHGVAQMDLGPRTDVLSGVPRANAMRMLVANMAPEVLITDELSVVEDVLAVWEAAHSGVQVVASAHAGSLRSLLCRESMRAALNDGLFTRIVLLSRSRGVGTVEQVLDANLQSVEGGGEACCAQLLS